MTTSSDPLIKELRNKLFDLEKQRVYMQMSDDKRKELILLKIDEEILKVKKNIANRQRTLISEGRKLR